MDVKTNAMSKNYCLTCFFWKNKCLARKGDYCKILNDTF